MSGRDDAGLLRGDNGEYRETMRQMVTQKHP